MATSVLATVVLCFFVAGFLSNYALADDPQVPCYFVFGDSLADPGNNNNLKTIAKANYEPYGVDFPGGANPTGRFTNGRTYVDFIGMIFISILTCCVNCSNVCMLMFYEFLCVHHCSSVAEFHFIRSVDWQCGCWKLYWCQLCLWCSWNPRRNWQN